MKILAVIAVSCAIAAVVARPQHKKDGKPTPPSHPHSGTDGPHGGAHGMRKPSSSESGSSEEGHHHGHDDNCHPYFTRAPFESTPEPFNPDMTDYTSYPEGSIEPATDFPVVSGATESADFPEEFTDSTGFYGTVSY
ncbi:hypothetical protein ANCCEY_00492 [Ancylostoma ceylanicum]|uniref:Uncharacterized protein n=1 Tax=Ancylostoma ceylanicum TaxID=53326 RepID=A0A0D6M8G5_9BILA|nr:hypothetical protein ANCCEY_00492 [Ancylostoma ceylanicum]